MHCIVHGVAKSQTLPSVFQLNFKIQQLKNEELYFKMGRRNLFEEYIGMAVEHMKKCATSDVNRELQVNFKMSYLYTLHTNPLTVI